MCDHTLKEVSFAFFMMMMMMVIVNSQSTQTIKETPCLWHILGQSLCQMINNGKCREKEEEMDDCAITGLKKQASLEFLAKKQKTNKNEEDTNSLSA